MGHWFKGLVGVASAVGNSIMASALSLPLLAFPISEYAIYIVLGVFTAIIFIDWAFFSRRGLPPGPRRLPIIGNVLQVPKSQEWFHWAKFLDTYGKHTERFRLLQLTILYKI